MTDGWSTTVAATRVEHRRLLGDVEQERLRSPRFAPDRERFLTGAARARLVVAERLGVPADRPDLTAVPTDPEESACLR